MNDSGMRVRIHRGATEIGGNCVEVHAAGATLLLDLGRPLTAARDEVVPLPPAIGLGEPGPPPLAVILSHGHADHWGLVPSLPPGIPVWIGQGAADVLRAAQFWGLGIDLHETGHLQHRTPIRIGPFTVTPYLADHSGFDAYSLLIDAAGRRVLYSGDLRGHGRKHRAFAALLADPPRDVDVLLLEGTSIRADTGDPTIPIEPVSEADVEDDLTATLQATTGLVVVLASAQNVDRLVTVYRATLRADRHLAVDLYTADVAAATGRDTIPHLSPDWPRLHAFLPLRQRIRVKQAQAFDRTNVIRDHRIYDEHLAASPGRWVLCGAYQSHIGHLLGAGLLTDGVVVWSLWDGYLTQPSGTQLVAVLDAAGIPLLHHHTSGHAATADLQRLVRAVAPHSVVPIHTEAPQQYTAVLDRPVDPHPDGEWWPA